MAAGFGVTVGHALETPCVALIVERNLAPVFPLGVCGTVNHWRREVVLEAMGLMYSRDPGPLDSGLRRKDGLGMPPDRAILTGIWTDRGRYQ